ncbi:MAG TPA: SRPBCC family protein [Actinomycetota bacterium]
MSRGRLTLDVGWGRSYFPLGPMEVGITAPREIVFDVTHGGYSERAPAEVKHHIQVIERAEDLVAEHRTPLKFLDAITVKTVRFERPSRVTFALLRGPVPHVQETFELVERDGATLLTYQGTLGADLWLFGRWYGGGVVRPAWERVVAASLKGVKTEAEARVAARARRAGDGPDATP